MTGMPVSWMRVVAVVFAVSWGANQFAPMQLVYRDTSGLTSTAFTAMLGTYALGLIPSLLYFGRLSDRVGRRAIVRPMVGVAMVSTVILALGADMPGLLYLGRVLAGVASGMAFTAGGAWIKELSDSPGAGARRTAVALSAGFGCGALFAGLIAQWLPMPDVLPYLVHLVMMVATGASVWRVPETRARAVERKAPTAGVVGQSWFIAGVAPWAPWVFGTATVAFATLPPHVSDVTGSLSVAFTGAVAALTLWTGVAVQPTARRLAGRGAMIPVATGVTFGCVGFASAAAALATTGAVSLGLIVLACVLLGSCYGMLLVSGLMIVENNIPVGGDLSSAVAVYYCFVYLGFAVPLLLSLAAPTLGLTVAAVLMVGGFAVARTRRS
ncbi:MFS transporter [Rhodococcus sp. RS1C4]|uniref:MFS transporter n=1 Tax=Nocardiaceae TaxID=85025 RepID=UPI000365B92A|nr:MULTISPECIES: MFS transporter [Rhodococcus]OZC50827.1 MFS transporter [Rhodococcus sp. 06-621-2]OZD27838.1 MFS transporter [Rhodococcus sp. 06-156-3b]OZC49353.1 MFS transporter [Rhodococcus sp. RS1C4]OZD11114.1 MFS transporter [Rhodococcus sp. 06-156-4C]OZD14530.1 MFS transporter [Rhodococcus sp. 06-156-4a]